MGLLHAFESWNHVTQCKAAVYDFSMAHLEFEQWVPFPVERVFLFFADPENLPRIMPHSTGARNVKVLLARPVSFPAEANFTQPIAGEGSQIVTSFRALPFLPIRLSWTASIIEFKWNGCFADDQTRGPFRRFRHRHHFLRSERNGTDGTIIHDVIDYEAGFGVLGVLAERLFISRMLKSVFEYRQHAAEQLLR